MHLCFIDESGHPPKPNKVGKRKHFVIAGVIMNEEQWPGIASELLKLKQRDEFQVRGEIKWRYFGPANSDTDNSVAHLDQEQRDKFRDELFTIITKRKSVKIVACVCHCEAAYKKPFVHGPEDIYQYTYKAVSERFQYYLQDLSREVGAKQQGIMIADHRGTKQDVELRKHHHELVDQDDLFVSEYKNYVETIFLTPSHHSVGIQLADMVAGAVARAFNTDEKRYANALLGSFRKNAQGNINGFGLVKFPRDW